MATISVHQHFSIKYLYHRAFYKPLNGNQYTVIGYHHTQIIRHSNLIITNWQLHVTELTQFT